MKIYFLRHGETDWNQLEKIQGRIDNPLSIRGINQGKQAKIQFDDKVKFTHAYASTLSRAMQTAQIILEDYDFPIKQDARLVERDFGELEGLAHDAYYQCEKSGLLPESVETQEAVSIRVQSFFQEIVKQHQAEDVILVSAHAHAIRSWTGKVFPEDFPFSKRLYNCQSIIIDYVDGKFSFSGVTDKVEIKE